MPCGRYRELTNNGASPMRVEQLQPGGSRLPGVTALSADLADERKRLQKEKDGLENKPRAFLQSDTSDPVLGQHLVKSLLLPRRGALTLLDAFRREDV